MSVRSMLLTDVPEVVNTHLKSFPGFFLSFLGDRFLRELYVGILMDSTGIAYVYEDQGHILGFVAGTAQPAGFYSRLLRRGWWRFGLASLVPISKNPLIVPRLLRAFRKPQDVSDQPDMGTLMSIAVAPDSQGLGLGQALVEAFLKEAARRGLKHVDLTTDKNNNDSVNRFYECMGFRCSRTFITAEGREMNEYVITIHHSSGEDSAWARYL